jgi:hypothetical protein
MPIASPIAAPRSGLEEDLTLGSQQVTCSIGAISRVEHYLPRLWGLLVEEKEATRQQLHCGAYSIQI